MKNSFKYLLSAFSLFVVLASCKKDENKIYYEGGTAPALSASVANNGTVPLSFVNKDNEAIKFSWSNPNYKFTTGVSSQNVSYLIEVDTAGANFTNPKRQTISIANDLSKTFTQAEFNDFLLNQMQLNTTMTHNLEVRVRSSINGSVPLYSNILKYTVTPYAIPPKVVPPASGKLFITGSATPGSWQCGCGEAELIPQKFNKISNTLYELPSIAITGGGSFLFLPVYGSWSAKYGYTGAGNTNNVDGDDFKDGGNDLKAPAVSGNYKIIVDFQRGKYEFIKL